MARAVGGPKVVSIADGNESPTLTAADLQDLGLRLVSYTVTALLTAIMQSLRR